MTRWKVERAKALGLPPRVAAYFLTPDAHRRRLAAGGFSDADWLAAMRFFSDAEARKEVAGGR